MTHGSTRTLIVATAMLASCGHAGVDEPAARGQLSPDVADTAAAIASLPWQERLTLEQALAEGDARYAPRMHDAAAILETPGAVVATLTASGASVRVGTSELTLRAASLGRAGKLRTLSASAPPVIDGAEVRTRRADGVTEWWRALPSGLEHGVTIERRPAGTGALVLELALAGELAARERSEDAIDLLDARGERVASYAHLAVLDATGAHVPARMSVEGGRIVVRADDADAHYPLVVDPMLVAIHEATLITPDGEASDQVGHTLALSADGSRAVLGAWLDSTEAGYRAGSARVFVRTAAGWEQEATLLAPDGVELDMFGYSVALSADGSRALIGVLGDDTEGGPETGSARVFVRSGTVWTQEATLLVPRPGRAGHSVALSADGSRALVGFGQRVFVRTGSAWAEEATLLRPAGGSDDNFVSVALNEDGSRALIGAPRADTAGGVEAGKAEFFVRAGASWTHEATLVAPDGEAYDRFGVSVALSADGTRAVIGANNDGPGSARVFRRTGTSWAQEATLSRLTSRGFGLSVALSADGTTALLGASPYERSAYVFVRSGTSWADQLTLTSSSVTPDSFGSVVALSADGSRALVGAPTDDTAGSDAGSAHVYFLGNADGVACTVGETCRSGLCVDGVCCASACGGSEANDCQACSAALTGGADGVCAPLSATAAAATTCRESTEVCDAAEVCSPSSTECPADINMCLWSDAGPADGPAVAASGCTCRVSTRRVPVPAALTALLALAALSVRRRRR